MSYILEALKRAESERSRGEVPGLYAQPVALAPAAVGRSAMAWWVVSGVVLVVMGVVAVVWWPRSSAPVVDVAPVPVVSEGGAPAARMVPKPPVAATEQVNQPAMPQPQLEHVKAPAATEVASTTEPVQPPAVVAPGGGVPEPRLRAEPSPRVRPVVTASAALPSAEARVYAVAELPEQIRSQLPALTVGGATYSENPASRMLILNGQLYHEGDRLAPELTLQHIQLRRAVLSFRGYRYAISY